MYNVSMSNAVAAILISDADTTDWFASSWKGAEVLSNPTVSRAGLEALVNAEVEAISDSYGINLPYNLAVHGSAVQRRREGNFRVTMEERSEFLSDYGRMAGWLRVVAESPLGRRFLKKTQSSNGVNSPYTVCSLWMVQSRYPSPHRFIKVLGKLMDRSRTILSAYGEISPSWRGIAKALESHVKAIGKMAVICTAITLEQMFRVNPNGFWGTDITNYQQARAWLIKSRGIGRFAETPAGLRELVAIVWQKTPRMTFDEALERTLLEAEFRTDDGVEGWFLVDTAITRHGITSSWGVVARDTDGETEWHRSWLIERGSRTFHTDTYTRLQAVQSALYSWKRQDQLERENDLTLPQDRTLLVFFQTSRDAGNCEAGTRSFQASMGWLNRDFIPVDWLMPHIDRPEVRRVVVQRLHRMK